MSTHQPPSITSSSNDKDVPTPELPEQYPPTKKVIPIMISLLSSVFLTSLDRTIIGTAIPTITNQFDSLGDVGWYASAYLLTACSFSLFIGRIYTFWNPKYVYLTCIAIFELGSLVCGAAPNSTAFIVGRALAGLGSAGLFQGGIIIVVHILPLPKRAMWMGFFGLCFGLASVVGPLLGGAFTDNISWRWCFYINLPIGAVVMTALTFLLQIPPQTFQRQSTTWAQKAGKLDPFGTLVFVPCMVCLLLALQWGGITYSWSNVRIIVLLVLFVLLLVAFIVIQKYKQATATIPPHIYFNRSMIAGTWFSFCTGASMMTIIYFVPIWFQAIKSVSAINSGIMILPQMVGVVIASISAGILTKKLGYYAPWMLASSIIAPIGVGLITTFTPSTGHAQWIGYQFLYGIGLGIGMQQPSIAAQTVLSKPDVPIGASLVFFSQTLGGAVFASVANNVFDTKLTNGLSQISGLDVRSIAQIGATELKTAVPPQFLPQVISVYNTALVNAFYVGLAMTCAGILGSATMEWRSVKKDTNQIQKSDKTQSLDVEAQPTTSISTPEKMN